MATDVATAEGKSEKSWNVFELFIAAITTVLLLGIGATIVALAGFAVVKGADVLYAGVHLVEHWSDEQAVPTDGELCKGLFCRRADTELKHVAGTPGRQSERFASFCPEHGRSDYFVFLDLSHLGSLLWYGYGLGVSICAVVWASLTVGASLALVGSPALLLLNADRRCAFFGLCATVGVLFGLLIGGAASLAYAWW